MRALDFCFKVKNYYAEGYKNKEELIEGVKPCKSG
jgi:hypothetical protein